MLYDIYADARAKYRISSSFRSRVRDRLFEAIIATAVRCHPQRENISFPERSHGDWWWTTRWKFEFLSQWLEYETLLAIAPYLSPGATVIDLGAHIGYYTWFFSKKIGCNGKVIAIEASINNYQTLTSNLSSLGISNTLCYNVAVSNHNGNCQLHLGPGHSSHSTVYEPNSSPMIEDVKCVCLDELLEKIQVQKVDFLKMDIEGGEIMALEGMEKTITNNPQLNAIIELNPKVLISAGYSPEELIERLLRFKFSTYRLVDKGLYPVAANDDFQSVENILCLGPLNQQVVK